jgi:predicted dehydrogenase
MADTIRTGIVGATVTQGGSGWGANAHVPALHILPDYTLQAVCTAHEDTAQASKAKFDAGHAFHDIDAMAQHPEIDLVVVCVRVPGHKNLVMAGLHVTAVPFHPSGTRLEIYGRAGTMVISAPGTFNIGPNVLYATKENAPLAEMPAPAQYTLVPEGTPPGPPRNVAQAYRRAAHAFASGTGFEVDVDLAVTRHKLIDAIERSAAEERVVKL